jgi:hypothetical protein
LNLGHPIVAPRRAPDLESKNPFNARARLSRPVLNASFEHVAHHGATSSFARFHARRNAGNDHGTGPVNSDAQDSASTDEAPWRTARTARVRRASNSPST